MHGPARDHRWLRAFVAIRRHCSCAQLYVHVLFEFCPEPPTHVGQPVGFVISDDESEEEFVVPEAMYMWDKGVNANTVLTLML